jgi:hypothetical protein
MGARFSSARFGMGARRGIALAIGSVALIVLSACGGSSVTPTPVPAAQAPVSKPAGAAQPAAAAKVATASARGTDSGAAATAPRAAGNATREAQAAITSGTATAAAEARAQQAVLAATTATAVADARAQQAATATSVAQANSAAATETARPAPTPVLPPGLNLLAGASSEKPEAVPLSFIGEGFVLLRDMPQLITDDMLLQWLMTQIRTEAGAWQSVDCFRKTVDLQCVSGQVFPPAKLNPVRPTYVYEWQKAIEQTPDLARGPMLDLFIRPDADWSFVKREAEWDDSYANFVQVFLFNRESVEGRQPEFAARELLPVFRRHLEAATARAPSTFWFNARINLKYDFATSTFRSSLPSGNIDLLNTAPLTGVGPDNNGYLSLGDLPETVQTRANYVLALAQPPALPTQTDNTGIHLPGLVLRVQEQLLLPVWQSGFSQLLQGQTAGDTRLPPLAVLSMDRQLQIPPIAMDAARAEAITKQLSAGGTVKATVYMAIEHALTFNWGSGANSRGQQALLTARVLKVDLALTPAQPGTSIQGQDEPLGSYSP